MASFDAVANMRADSNLYDGKLAVLASVGTYRYSASSTAADNGTTVIKPTVLGTDPGAYLYFAP